MPCWDPSFYLPYFGVIYFLLLLCIFCGYGVLTKHPQWLRCGRRSQPDAKTSLRFPKKNAGPRQWSRWRSHRRRARIQSDGTGVCRFTFGANLKVQDGLNNMEEKAAIDKVLSKSRISLSLGEWDTRHSRGSINREPRTHWCFLLWFSPRVSGNRGSKLSTADSNSHKVKAKADQQP